MTYRARLLAAAALAGTAGLGADFLRPHTRPPVFPGIPYRDYQQGGPFPQAQILSKGGVLLLELVDRTKAIATVKKRTRYFQLNQETLRVGHCFLSKVAVVIYEDGEWTFNARADQNPWFARESPRLPGLRLPNLADEETTNFLKRNEFFVKLSFVAAAKQREESRIAGTGMPVMAVCCPPPFWVQRGQPLHHMARGCNTDLARSFDTVDRVELLLKIE
jgi:hypothetical protein